MCALIVDKAIPGLTAFVSHTLDCKCGYSGTGSDEHQRRGKAVCCLLKRATTGPVSGERPDLKVCGNSSDARPSWLPGFLAIISNPATILGGVLQTRPMC